MPPLLGNARSAAVGYDNPVRVRLVSAVLLGIAAFTFWLSVPRLVAGIATAPHGDTLANLNKPELSSAGAVARAIDGYRRALAWRSDPIAAAALGALDIATAQRSQAVGQMDTARKALSESVFYNRASLAASPLQPYAWMRLVQAELNNVAPADEEARHLRMAVETAPWEPALITARLGMAFMLWDQFDSTVQTSFAAQIRYAARIYPSALAYQTRQHRAQNQVLGALEDDADLLRRFSLAYSRL